MKHLFLALCLTTCAPAFATDITPSTQAASVATSSTVIVAQASVPAPVPAVQPAAPVPAPAQDSIGAQDLLSQVLQLIHDWGGLSWVLKMAAIFTLILSSMKVSFLNDLLWSKLGNFKAWAAPVLGLVVGVLDLAKNGQLSMAGVMAFVSAGAGAIILHELLDTIKAIPGLGPQWVEIINVVSSFLGGPAPTAQA